MQLKGLDIMTDGLSNFLPPPPAGFQPRYPQGYWDDASEYLRQCFILQHNEDYLEFLVRNVWKLSHVCRLVEFGCGFGKI